MSGFVLISDEYERCEERGSEGVGMKVWCTRFMHFSFAVRLVMYILDNGSVCSYSGVRRQGLAQVLLRSLPAVVLLSTPALPLHLSQAYSIS